MISKRITSAIAVAGLVGIVSAGAQASLPNGDADINFVEQTQVAQTVTGAAVASDFIDEQAQIN